jgi:hypothetical protein
MLDIKRSKKMLIKMARLINKKSLETTISPATNKVAGYGSAKWELESLSY